MCSDQGDLRRKLTNNFREVLYRYLGQILHSDGNRASYAATIAELEGKINGAAFEVQSLIEDFKMQAIGGIMAAWELYEKAMVPSLLSGVGTLMGISNVEIDRLDSVQDIFWRLMLCVPESCPKVALLLCQDCPGREIQTKSHCVVCPRWDKLRTGLELRLGHLLSEVVI